MTNAVIEKLDDEEIDALVKMLKDISAFSEVISHNTGKRKSDKAGFVVWMNLFLFWN